MQAQSFQMMREAMQELQQASEGSLAKVLDKTQVKRLIEIQLQVEGPAAVIREDVAEKLEITEEQHADIQTVLNEANVARRQIMQKNFQFMRTLMPNQPGGGNPPAADAQADPNAAPTPAAGQGGQPGQGGRGNRGGRGGANGQNNRPRVDPEAMQKIMEQPEVKAKMEEHARRQNSFVSASTPWFTRPWIDVRSRRSRKCWASRLTSNRSQGAEASSAVDAEGPEGAGTEPMATQPDAPRQLKPIPPRRPPRGLPLTPAQHDQVGRDSPTAKLA